MIGSIGPDDAFAVQAEIVGIAAHHRLGLMLAWNDREVTLLNAEEIGCLDIEIGSDVLDALIAQIPKATKFRAYLPDRALGGGGVRVV